MNFNLMKMFASLQRSRNPQQALMQMIQQQMPQGNPMTQQMISLLQSNNPKEIESFARNVAKEKGIDYDKEFTNFKNFLGI